MKKLLLPALVVFLLSIVSCKKESFITSSEARLSTSADTIKFDTVFTQTGSATRFFKIKNENDQKLLLSQVKLMGGTASPYRVNINGTAAHEVNNIELAANDSIYVFVTVTIDPSSANLPFIVSDSILIHYNNNNRYVQLQAYGQNANFLTNAIITGNVTWTNGLPYVILGGCRIDTTASLTVEAGTRVYLHADAAMIVDGSITVNGSAGNRVIFTGDRLDEYYRDLPASWPGITFRGESHDNVLTFAVIKNAVRALTVSGPSVNMNPKLVLHQCVIDNSYLSGISASQTSIRADNCLVSNCGSNIVINLGGQYDFTHCTIVSYSTDFMLHKTPVLTATDFAELNGNIVTADLSANFTNCIIWGSDGIVTDEIVTERAGNNLFNVLLDHCLFRAEHDPGNTTFEAVVRNEDPVFDSIDPGNHYFDFRVTKEPFAPGIDRGVTTIFTQDLDGANRNAGLPDLGSYEKQ